MFRIAEVLPGGNHIGTTDIVDEFGDVVPIDSATGLDVFLGSAATRGVFKEDETPGEALASTSPDELATRTELVDPETRARRRAEVLLATRGTRPDLGKELPSDDNRGMYGR